MKAQRAPFLDAVRAAARAQDALRDPRWDALAAGELSPEAAEDLRREAQRDATTAEAYEMFRPLDADVQERMIARALGAEGGGRKEDAPRGEVVPLPRRQRLPFVLLVAASLAAIVLTLLFGGTRAPDRLAGDGPLPAYEIAMRGGERDVRVEPEPPGDVPRLESPDTRLEVTLRPATEVRGPVAVRCGLRGVGAGRAWEPRASIKPGGTVVIAGSKRELFAGVPGGTWELVCAVGRQDALPAPAALLAAPPGSSGEAFQVLTGRVKLDDAR